MQDRYVGDVGDFAKFAILRRLAGLCCERQLRISVVWCRFPNENHNNDGRHISYINSAAFLGLDDELRSALSDLISRDKRNIAALVTAGILPVNTLFYDAPVAFVEGDRKRRISDRSTWLEACLSLNEDCDLVFFDPDNGLEIPSVPKGHPKSGKYIYWDELLQFWRRGNALLIYHHLNRRTSGAQQIETLSKAFKEKFEGSDFVPLVFRRGSSRVFCLVHRGDEAGRELEQRATDLLRSGWSQHFRPPGWPGDVQANAGTP